MNLQRAYNIELQDERCFSCGRFWMAEQRRRQCPYCAADAIEQLEEELRGVRITVSRLRGVITRIKHRLKS